MCSLMCWLCYLLLLCSIDIVHCTTNNFAVLDDLRNSLGLGSIWSSSDPCVTRKLLKTEPM
jgi:hypothetical protein